MKNKLLYRKDLFLLLILMIGVMFYFYAPIILAPNAHLFTATGDGMKNYYTYAYFISNNTSWTNFEGMNYPYGENIFYTDCTPILSFTIKFFSLFIPQIKHYSIGILNELLMFSFVVCSIQIHRIFKLFQVNWLFSVLSAIAITFLSPQVFRLTGHLALGFNFIIPTTILLVLKWFNSRKSKFLIYLSLTIICSFLIHAYLGMIVFLFAFSFGFLEFALFFSNSNKKEKITYLISILSPLLLFNSLVKLTDIHTGRTNNPYGFFSYYSSLKSFFLPSFGYLNQFLATLFKLPDQNWEAINFIGVIAICTLPFILIYVVRLFKNFNSKQFTQENQRLSILFMSSIIVMGFSMCLPFRFKLHFLVDVIPQLKQFRALGRFGWVTFYGFNIISVIFLNKILINKIAIRFIKNISFIVLPLFTFSQAYNYHTFIGSEIKATPNFFKHKPKNFINSSDFQAILPLPFFYIGSENSLKEVNDSKIYATTMLLSYHLKLPILGSYLTRTSIWEARNSMQIVGNPFYIKSIQNDVNERPVLILDFPTSKTVFEHDILLQAKRLKRMKDCTIFTINKKQLFHQKKLNKQTYQYYLRWRNKIDSEHVFLFKSKMGALRDYSKIFSIQEEKLYPHKKYRIRFWMSFDGDNFGQDMINSSVFVQKEYANQVKWMTNVVNPMQSSTICNKSLLVDIQFTTDSIFSRKSKYSVYIKGDDFSTKQFKIESFWFYPENDTLVYSKNGLWINGNYYH